MTTAPAQPLRADSRLLLAHTGTGSLPSPVALQLLDIPFVLPLKQLPDRVDRQLPRWAYEITYSLVGADRTRYEVRVTGDPTLGLPFGQDADVLLALFKILEQEPTQHNLESGTFRNPSFQMICRALGKTPTGRRVREIRDALMRLAGVRIYSRVLVDKLVRAAKVLAADGTAPEVPTAGTVRRDVTHEMRWLLEYRAQERFERPATVASSGREPGPDDEAALDGAHSQMWIQHLALNPFWVAQAVAGWAGWIDVERHARLKSPTARRLYQICAATAARQVATPWAFPEDALNAACLLTTSATKKPTKIRQQLENAAEELREAGVLASAAWHGAKRGPKTFEVQPAPLLQFADLLRGIGLTDPPDFRVQYAVLRHFGVTPTKARAMLAEHPGQVGDVLLRACHLEATDPAAIEKSWAGWIVHHVQAGTSFRGEVEFQRWRSSALAAIEQRDARLLDPASDVDAAQLTLVAPATGQPLLDTPTERIPAAFAGPAADAEAAARWAPALDEVLPTVGPLDRYGLELAVPIGWRAAPAADGAASAELTVWVHAEDVVATRSLTRSLTRLESVLAGLTGGPVRVTLAHRLPGA